MRFIRKKNENLLIKEFIKILKGEIIKKKKEKKRLSFVLTGGDSPKKLYKKLSRSNINWIPTTRLHWSRHTVKIN